MRSLLPLLLLLLVALPATKFGAEFEKEGSCPLADSETIHVGKGDIGDPQLEKLLSRLRQSENQNQQETPSRVQEI